MSERFDAIVIGSGFGGAISACRLAQRGMKVLVLERGRRWTPREYPRRPGDAWLYNPDRPERRNGWLDLRFFPSMTVAQAAGVGGGSLTYSNVAIEAEPQLFAEDWPAEITYPELKPYYDVVAQMMNLQTVPEGQLTQRFKLAQEAATATGHGARFKSLPLAVSFSPEWHYGLPEPFDARHSRQFVNAQGQTQGTCIHLGNCDVGCDVRAKNTLDLNYIPAAEQAGAEVRPLHVVRTVEPRGGAYRVVFDRIENQALRRGEATATHVFLAAGSLGSTELLLRCRDEFRTLPGISSRLGHGWSANANVISMATYPDGGRVQQTWGPTISAGIDFTDGGAGEHRFIVEDDGFPNVLLNALRACVADGPRPEGVRTMLRHLETSVSADEASRNRMVWLGAGKDGADGQLALRRRFFTPWERTLDLRWNPRRSEGVVNAILHLHRRLTEATGGKMLPSASWSVLRNMLTLHPLGGCRMGSSAESGVVDHRGQVFGYRNLFVADGAIIPGSTGRNPSHTIAALAERIATHVQ